MAKDQPKTNTVQSINSTKREDRWIQSTGRRIGELELEKRSGKKAT